MSPATRFDVEGLSDDVLGKIDGSGALAVAGGCAALFGVFKVLLLDDGRRIPRLAHLRDDSATDAC